MKDLWKEVIDEIEVEISKPQFITFFKDTALKSFEKGVATVSAPSYMTADYIEKRYYSLIKKVLDKKSGKNTSLVFITEVMKSEKQDQAGPLFAEQITKNAQRSLQIREDYTFDTFAVSDSNQLAYTAAMTIATDPGKKYNPLYLYGSVGVGKTHLMNAISNKVLEKESRSKTVCLTTEEFTNEVVEAIRDKTTTKLRRKFRDADLLLLDDVQFLSGKEKVQEELFHTFNALINKGKQVVLSSDRPPHEIKKIEVRLASRFEGGLTVDIQPPDFELRTAIVLIKCKKHGVPISLDHAKRVSERTSDARALEGIVLKLLSLMPPGGGEITDSLVDKSLGKEKETVVHPDDVIKTVCSYFNLKPTQLKGARRDSHLVRSRHICMYLLKEDLGLPLVEIGNLLGGRDHTTVIHGVEKIRTMRQKSKNIREEILLIKRRIGEGFLQ